MADNNEKEQDLNTADKQEEYKSRRFRFKSSTKDAHKIDKKHRSSNHHSRRSHHHHHRHTSRPKPSPPPPHQTSTLDPDAAFRESLFDALADDEGAEYWAGVYGQPIHTYPRAPAADGSGAGAGGAAAELEAMTDDEYAEYVRRRMWEKSHQHVIEERARREEVRQKQRQQQQQQQQRTEAAGSKDKEKKGDRSHFDAQVEQALRFGAARRRAVDSQVQWDRYTEQWERLTAAAGAGTADARRATAVIPWPVQSGRRQDVGRDEVERFFRARPVGELHAVLKVERVRWHPDKMGNLFGGAVLLGDEVKQAVTAVFQIVDDLWRTVK